MRPFDITVYLNKTGKEKFTILASDPSHALEIVLRLLPSAKFVYVKAD